MYKCRQAAIDLANAYVDGFEFRHQSQSLEELFKDVTELLLVVPTAEFIDDDEVPPRLEAMLRVVEAQALPQNSPAHAQALADAETRLAVALAAGAVVEDVEEAEDMTDDEEAAAGEEDMSADEGAAAEEEAMSRRADAESGSLDPHVIWEVLKGGQYADRRADGLALASQRLVAKLKRELQA